MAAATSERAAYGGSADRKRAAIGLAREGLAALPRVMSLASLHLATEGDNHSTVYCAAFGTKDAAELTDRSGLPVDLLLLIMAVLSACEYWEADSESGMRLRVAKAAQDAAIRALEAIPVGADTSAISTRYLLALLERFGSLRDWNGRSLGTDARGALEQVLALHAAASTDAAAYRSARRAATVANNSADRDLDRVVLAFVESVAWPTNSLSAELPGLVWKCLTELRLAVASEQLSTAERDIVQAAAAVQNALFERMNVDPGVTLEWLFERMRQSPEVVAAETPHIRARIAHCTRVASEEFASGTLDVLFATLRER